MSKRLELIWPDKDKVLLGLDENGKPIWGTKADLETRLLVQLDAIGETSADNLNDLYEQGDNLLIKGDNLLALKALEQHFAGKIKCIYIDPPFNTGNAFEYYDDGLEHTIWLSMMKGRLEILRKLLREDGAIFVHIDYNEEPYLRVLMDEVFGRTNYRNTIIVSRVRKNIRERERVKALNFGHGPILFYAKSENTVIEPPTFTQEKGERWHAFDAPGIRPTMEYKLFGYDPPKGRHWMFEEAKAREMIAKGELRQNPRTGKPQYRLAPSSETMFDTLWTDVQESAFNWGLQGGEKSEKLIHRILQMVTSPGDWVLDSFLGSGTTAAVAHKMGRKWIGVEMGEHAETLCLPRLKLAVRGEDQTGISRQVGWKGGGGFRYCVLGESLFDKDEDTGLVMINPKYTNGPLVAAVCNLEDFNLNDDSIFHGVRGNMYAHVAEDKVTQAYLDALVEKLPHGKNLVVYYLKRATGLEVPQEVKVKRIPKELQIPRYLTSASRGGGE